MKKKIFVFIMFAVCILTFTACGKTKLDLNKFVIEQRENLFTASDDLYTATISTGSRESDYNFDGTVGEMVPFGVLTFTKNNNLPLANDTYAFTVSINDQTYSGNLEKSSVNNSYVTDLEISIVGDEIINVKIDFTGYCFNQELVNTSSEFNVDCKTALDIAQKELKENINNLLDDKNVKIEVVMKIMKDYSSTELKNYYWYVGVVSTNGDTLGILIDANTGNVIAKKV